MIVSNAKNDVGCGLIDTDIDGLSDLYFPQEDKDSHVRDVADVLLEIGKITPETYEQLRRKSANAVTEAPDTDALLLQAKLCSEDDILMAKASLCGLEFRRIEPEDVGKEAFEKLEIDFIKSSSVCPVAIQGQTLIVATSRPADLFVIEDVKRQTQMNVEVLVCPEEDINKACDAFEKERIDYGLDDVISDMADVEVVKEQKDDLEDLEKMAGQSPVIKFVNYLISNAIREGA
ncbi:MAG: GspE/PulE/PilB domain-containing protein, partial [Planctomycetota bacterium]